MSTPESCGVAACPALRPIEDGRGIDGGATLQEHAHKVRVGVSGRNRALEGSAAKVVASVERGLAVGSGQQPGDPIEIRVADCLRQGVVGYGRRFSSWVCGGCLLSMCLACTS